MEGNNKRTSGFTLLEILIVVGITVIIAGFSAYAFFGYQASQQVEDNARSLVAILKSAQEKSIGRDSDSRWGVFFNTQPQRDSYYLYQVDEGLLVSGEYTDAPGSIIDQRTLRASVRIILPDSKVTSTIIFAKNTGFPSETATIEIRNIADPSITRNVIISTNGLIKHE